MDGTFGSWDTRNGVSPWDQFTRRAESGGNAERGNVHWQRYIFDYRSFM